MSHRSRALDQHTCALAHTYLAFAITICEPSGADASWFVVDCPADLASFTCGSIAICAAAVVVWQDLHSTQSYTPGTVSAQAHRAKGEAHMMYSKCGM
jgi:hypothetical protein